METLNPSDVCRQAGERLQRVDHPKRLVLIHTAIALGASLLVTALNFFLSKQIAGTGGLGGLGLRAFLSTVQAVLELAVAVGLPFWEIGLLFAALRWARGENIGFGGLLQGFRRFGTVLGMRLMRGGLFLVAAIAVFYLSTTVFLLTPLSTPLIDFLEPIVADAAAPQQIESLLTPELMAAAADKMVALFVIFAILYAIVAVPVYYRLRFSEFAVMEGTGAVKAMVQSLRLTQGNSLKLVRLDLHFWWFYLLQGLCVAVSYGDMLLPALGIALPVSGDVGFFLCFVLGALCQGVLLWQCEGKRLTAYALVYETLGERTAVPQKVQEASNVPWDV